MTTCQGLGTQVENKSNVVSVLMGHTDFQEQLEQVSANFNSWANLSLCPILEIKLEQSCSFSDILSVAAFLLQ